MENRQDSRLMTLYGKHRLGLELNLALSCRIFSRKPKLQG